MFVRLIFVLKILFNWNCYNYFLSINVFVWDMCVCLCMYLYVHVDVCVNSSLYLGTYVSVFGVCVSMCVWMFVCMFVFLNVCFWVSDCVCDVGVYLLCVCTCVPVHVFMCSTIFFPGLANTRWNAFYVLASTKWYGFCLCVFAYVFTLKVSAWLCMCAFVCACE